MVDVSYLQYIGVPCCCRLLHHLPVLRRQKRPYRWRMCQWTGSRPSSITWASPPWWIPSEGTESAASPSIDLDHTRISWAWTRPASMKLWRLPSTKTMYWIGKRAIRWSQKIFFCRYHLQLLTWRYVCSMHVYMYGRLCLLLCTIKRFTHLYISSHYLLVLNFCMYATGQRRFLP